MGENPLFMVHIQQPSLSPPQISHKIQVTYLHQNRWELCIPRSEPSVTPQWQSTDQGKWRGLWFVWIPNQTPAQEPMASCENVLEPHQHYTNFEPLRLKQDQLQFEPHLEENEITNGKWRSLWARAEGEGVSQWLSGGRISLVERIANAKVLG